MEGEGALLPKRDLRRVIQRWRSRHRDRETRWPTLKKNRANRNDYAENNGRQ